MGNYVIQHCQYTNSMRYLASCELISCPATGSSINIAGTLYRNAQEVHYVIVRDAIILTLVMMSVPPLKSAPFTSAKTSSYTASLETKGNILYEMSFSNVDPLPNEFLSLTTLYQKYYLRVCKVVGNPHQKL